MTFMQLWWSPVLWIALFYALFGVSMYIELRIRNSRCWRNRAFLRAASRQTEPVYKRLSHTRNPDRQLPAPEPKYHQRRHSFDFIDDEDQARMMSERCRNDDDVVDMEIQCMD